MSSGKRSRKSAEERKAEIVKTAIHLAAEVGPDRVTTQRIADSVGLTQPGIFRHFPTKADIWLAVGEWIAPSEEGNAGPKILKANTTSPVHFLQDLVARYLAGIARNPAIPAILFSRELHAENEKLRAHFEHIMERRRKRFTNLAQLAQDQRQILTTIPASDLVALILALIQGLAMRWSLENRSFDLEAEGVRLLNHLLQPQSPT